jgi:parallel beta-helix repeat protein
MQFVGENAELVGDGREFAFAGVKGGTGGKRVRLQGLDISGYTPAAQSAAIRPFGYAHDWIMEDCQIHDNANWAVQVDAGWQVRRCFIYRNGTLGIGGGGDALIEDCSIYENNTTGADSHWEAGGTKFVYADGLVIRRCHVVGNDGPGIWFDGHTNGAYIQSNQVFDNRGPGIDWEINGACLIEGNQCERNGSDSNWADDYDLAGGGILIIDSAGVIVRDNVLLDNAGGIGLVDDNRSGRSSWPNLENIKVSGNRIRYAARKHGAAIASGRPALSSSVVFDNNRYEVDPSRVGFRIGSTNLSLAGWQAKYPTDLLYEQPVEPPPPVRPAKPVIFGVERSILWQPVPDADWYRVQVMTDEGWLTFADTVQHEITVGARGRYRLRAVNGAGVSPWQSVLV